MYAWDADEDYEFDQIDGIDVQEPPIGTRLEVSVSHGHWSGVVWDIGICFMKILAKYESSCVQTGEAGSALVRRIDDR